MASGSDFKKEILNYVENLPELCANYRPSLFWEELVKDFNANLKNTDFGRFDLEAVWELTKSLMQEPPFQFNKKPKKQNWLLSNFKYFCHRNHILKLSKGEVENIAALKFLRERGLYEDYEKFRMRIGADSLMPLARHFYYADLIEKFVKKKLSGGPLNVLEIGAGRGMFARTLYEKKMVKTYHIIDLPQILLSSILTLYSGLPSETFHCWLNNDDGVSTFNFYPAQYAEKVPKHHFDLILNFNSFQEMDREVRDTYIKNIKEWASKPALFVNVNRRQNGNLPQSDGSKFDNNPLLYPYDPKEQVIEWSVDQMQDSIRANVNASLYAITPKSFSILRVSLLE